MGFYEKMSELMSDYNLYSQEEVEDKRVLVVLHGFMNIGGDLLSMHWYVTEFDPISGDMFGYVLNDTDPFCSEWGYSNLKHLLEYNCIGAYLDLSKQDSKVSQILKGIAGV